ncbi:MAG: hypothetical protein JST93_13355 [Acidobacteria bacterium]|nr:hypothetical protein [Acidobacteriota bacterium]
MRLSILAGLVLLATLATPAVQAGTTYNINFSGSGTLPTAGSFVYDSGTSTFSAFTVEWAGITFDLTASANAPSTAGAGFGSCISPLTGGAATFAMLSGACDGVPNQSSAWSSSALSGLGLFQFLTVNNVLVGGAYPQLFISQTLSVPDDLDSFGAGTWSISPAVPEPSTAILWLTGFAPVAIAMRRRPHSIGKRF